MTIGVAFVEQAIRIIEDDGLEDVHPSDSGLVKDLLRSLDVVKKACRETNDGDVNLRLEKAVSACKAIVNKCTEHFHSVHHSLITHAWRRLYTDASLDVALANLILSDDSLDLGKGGPAKSACAREGIECLDMALIVTSAPGPGRYELAQDMIRALQANYTKSVADQGPATPRSLSKTQDLPEAMPFDDEVTSSKKQRFGKPDLGVPCRAKSDIRVVETNPSLEDLDQINVHGPCIIRCGLTSDWPALDEFCEVDGDAGSEEVEGEDHCSGQGRKRKAGSLREPNRARVPKWKSRRYLLDLAGPCRSVPVEIGGDYTQERWSQKIMPLEKFLGKAGWSSPTSSNESEGSDGEAATVYLAQHDIFHQFESLRRDVLVPDIVHTCPMEGRKGPPPEEGYIMNAWLGPAGTFSPPHTDPYYNAYGEYSILFNASLPSCSHLSRWAGTNSSSRRSEACLDHSSGFRCRRRHVSVFCRGARKHIASPRLFDRRI